MLDAAELSGDSLKGSQARIAVPPSRLARSDPCVVRIITAYLCDLATTLMQGIPTPRRLLAIDEFVPSL